ncbi:putative S-adenosyl-L-methionine-dependent methyltransferase [Mycolicibacterium madagascariense]|uniref:S-adenosyl-L-methionine-dependent methyltransferase n=1 Tax=Mycolicibacterium madagascariense TaxID=212765 RepID=A0A7I7X8V1_9MYCO|nr:class I SAM-dependent methyltransferase [Mycolicibacterium madagascariense]MCV7015021.1 class I SAM-dependent methyltransferase [Mycolicibacterium madagascariense]BBZ25984.1 putative S-adenosyl-L-methionine-dependent methyltransferase [Mycolicibacterium madagascariense]
MGRTDDDTWDVTESVGATALMVAGARAAETESAAPLFRDPLARVFLDAAGEGTWNVFDRAGGDADPELAGHLRSLLDFFAARTAFIDDFFSAASEAGIRQVVILASGLDSRAWRLPWPDGTRVFELDQPKVLAFKAATLREHGAQPTAERTEVAIDLRQDWPMTLRQNGFDEAAPTAWSVEGLLRYLPSHAQDLLFERLHELSAPGSRVVANAPTDDAASPDRVARERELTQRFSSVASTGGATTDVAALSYAETRTDVVGWLREHGWEASATSVPEAVAHYRGRPAAEADAIPSTFISGRRRTIHDEEDS